MSDEHRRKQLLARTLAVVIIVAIVITICLTPFWSVIK